MREFNLEAQQKFAIEIAHRWYSFEVLFADLTLN
jgi:hypothetical protein